MPEDVCRKCADHLAANPHIIGACASVGIEHAMTTPETVQAFMRGLHEREGH